MQVAKWGNSLAVRLPKTVVEALRLKAGDEIEIVVAGSNRFEIARDKSREKALARLKALKRPLPKGFKFDRNEANECASRKLVRSSRWKSGPSKE